MIDTEAPFASLELQLAKSLRECAEIGYRAALADVERELRMAGRYTDDARKILAKLRGGK